MVATKKTEECRSTEDRAEIKAVLSAVRPRKSTKGKQRPTYRRRVKPPHSYAELITMAIKSSPSCMMTLREILDHMSASYECFRGSYIGWKNSVRHNLSANDFFVKVLRNNQRPYGKDNFWTLSPSCPHCLGESPDREPSAGSSPLHQPFQPRVNSSSSPINAGTSHHSEEAAAPYLSAVNQPAAPVTRCPSPTPGCTPETGTAPASVNHQACDEWSQLEDLFVPDADIDLALYDEDFEFAIPHQPSAPAQVCLGSAGQDRSSLAHIKTEYHPSYPEYLPADYAPYQPRHSLFPHGITERQMRFLPHISSSVTARLRIKSEYTSTTTIESSNFVCGDPGSYPPSPEPFLHEAGYPAERRPDQYRLGSIVASAIRGSLSLDLDESALQAIERSVRLLDRPRPDDLICA
ncbi:hepatocyte nuclear factor 3-gamma-like [Patiria miniata]|uniref:Fork-head domain-containing protein n=1 Tax=Patiria miniata TaxID=46514 RepID=A0A914B2E3_PATMI|nr:hepatocyte nuclear factor 3-gamma-like [Patiria miniata]